MNLFMSHALFHYFFSNLIFSKHAELEIGSQVHIFCKTLSEMKSGKDENMEQKKRIKNAVGWRNLQLLTVRCVREGLAQMQSKADRLIAYFRGSRIRFIDTFS